MSRAAVSPRALDAVREGAPAGVEVIELDDEMSLQGFDFLVPSNQTVLERLEQLQRPALIQVLSAGTDWIEPHVPAQVTLCNARGARDAPVAEWVLGALLGASTGLLRATCKQQWEEDRRLTDLGGSTVVIVGMGSIGRRLAAYLAPLDANVIGVASRARDDLRGVDELPAILPDADSVVVLAPLSDATHGLIGRAELAALRDGAVVVNAARGPVVDADALLAEVGSGRLQAVLDVTDPEPLPDEHPLWSAPGTLAITPHLAGDSDAGGARAAELAAAQLRRWVAGEPLHNVVSSSGS
jgi:phosphoglycerate dehydrogenase-like enzyme